ncbi:hypothetical protein SAMN04489806_1925 [Paramicrobacterium humi]|uniref:Lasso RiPP family leader peptide-containing protein n=1 Tax=Paramicrobacterium humi TaxID=640635 RepID=A0A1H4MPG6_9MICO|nr:hypothetical protein SAMN04489806_1925 [Microbacterium humi]
MMAYESPRIREVGRFSDVTLGRHLDFDFDDGIYVWGVPIPAGDGHKGSS